MTTMEATTTVPVRQNFTQVLAQHGLGPLRRAPLQELQINLGKLCNQACNHCHVDAGPKRTEIMTWSTASKIMQWAVDNNVQRVDVTGGAPEMNPNFRTMVEFFLAHGMLVTARCNLSILLEPGYTDLAQWYADNKVHLACSLPCYSESNVDAQRGNGVFRKSIEALQLLNRFGYGVEQELKLDLVYNPGGAFLPPAQHELESEYKRRLKQDFDISFNNLFTITNLPISRFEHFLERTGQRESYMKLLLESFNPGTVDSLMCRHLISVDWQGKIYDCDFNQMLELPYAGSRSRYLWELGADDTTNQPIAVGEHCLGCTAGAGSSCGGALE